MADFNPYIEWLGLSADLAEPNHYQLLGLANFEGDVAKITIAADKAMSRVRGFRPGPNAKAWSKLLDELLLAKGRLLDPERKSEYDADLRESGSATPPAAPSPAPSAAPTTTSAGWDPRFPPGMGPNVGKSAPTKSEPARAPEPAAAPAPVTPAPIATAPIPTVAPAAVPVATIPSMPPTAWPSSMLHQAPQVAGYPQPQQPSYPAPAQPYPQQPQYAQPAYGQPTGYPQQQPAYPQPQYSAPAYPVAPVYPQPTAYAQQPASPYGQPQYPAANYAAPLAAEPPVSNYGYGQFQPPQAPTGLAGYGATAHSPYGMSDAANGMALDPMAPVAMPTALPSQDEAKQARIVGFAAHQAGASAIPRGKAVSSSPAASTAPAATNSPVATIAPSAPVPSMAPALVGNSVESAVTAARLEKSKSDQTLFYVSGGAILLLLCAIIFAVINANSGPTEVAQNPTVHVPPEPHTPAKVEPVKPKVVPPKPIEPIKPKPVEPKPPPMREPMRNPGEEMPAETKPIEPVVPKPVEPKPTLPEAMPADPKPPEPKPVEPKPTEPKPPEPTTIPVPMPPKPADPPAETKLTAAELTALSAAMNGAKEALRERNFDETDKHLATAKTLAKSTEQLAKLNRLEVLTQYVKQFDRSLKTLMADENFDAGSELVLGKSTRVVVVERSPTGIVIRINGQNKSYTLANMPDGLAMALIDLRLPVADPVSKVIKGAYLAAAKVSTEDNQNKAKELWAEAVQGGVSEVADLPLVLTDTYDFKE